MNLGWSCGVELEIWLSVCEQAFAAGALGAFRQRHLLRVHKITSEVATIVGFSDSSGLSGNKTRCICQSGWRSPAGRVSGSRQAQETFLRQKQATNPRPEVHKVLLTYMKHSCSCNNSLRWYAIF